MTAVTICNDFGAQENKVSHCFHCSPSIYHEVMGPDVRILIFWMLSFKPPFSLSSFTFINRIFSSSLSAIRVRSSAYLRLLIFLSKILIPACASSDLVFRMMWRRLSTEELMLLNCGVGEDSWESLGLQGNPTSPFWRRAALGFLWKEWC